MRTTPIKLAPGDDLRLRLEQLAREEQASGFVLGVVGNLVQGRFSMPRATRTHGDGRIWKSSRSTAR